VPIYMYVHTTHNTQKHVDVYTHTCVCVVYVCACVVVLYVCAFVCIRVCVCVHLCACFRASVCALFCLWFLK